jgi:hypothetical protein
MLVYEFISYPFNQYEFRRAEEQCFGQEGTLNVPNPFR